MHRYSFFLFINEEAVGSFPTLLGTGKRDGFLDQVLTSNSV